MTTFPERLQARMDALNMNQMDIVRATGFTQACISQYVNGQREPHSDHIVRLSEVLECSTDYLIGRIDTLFYDTAFIEDDPVLREFATGLLSMSDTAKRWLTDFYKFKEAGGLT